MTVQEAATGRRSDWLRRVRSLPVPSAGRRLVELLVLTGFVVAQPVLDVYGKASEVFVFRDISGVGVLAFTATVVVVPPLALWLVGSAAAAVNDVAGRLVHGGCMLVLWVALWVEVLAYLDAPPAVALAVGALLGVCSTALFTLRPAFRMWLSYASPAPLVFALVFLLLTPVSGLVLADGGPVAQKVTIGQPAPVVMVVLDEFPLASLLGADDQIDADLYPHLAALQASSNTYLNATSNSPRTPYSVPSMLTGQLPAEGDLPTAATRPDNLFALLGRSHDLRVHELLSMCPDELCSRERRSAFDGFGSLLGNGVETFVEIVDPRGDQVTPGADRGEAVAAMRRRSGDPSRSGEPSNRAEGSDLLLPDRFSAFLDDLDRPGRGGRPVFGFFHILLPHAPWLLTPTGQRYAASPGLPGVLDMDGEIAWEADGRFLDLARQRHLLQVQYVDRMVGELMRRLTAAGTWDDALVVLTADHGVAFRAGQPRRAPTAANLSELAWVPLFVKQPGQRTGSTSMANAQLIDVAPTVADVLDVPLPWQVDGRSLLGTARPAAQRRPFLDDGGEVLRLDGVRLRPEVWARSVATFAPAVGDPLRVFRAGPGADLVGRPVAELEPGPPVAGRVRLKLPDSWRWVQPAADLLPLYRTGTVRGLPAGVSRVAVAVNGVVAGVSDLSRGPGDRAFAVLVPPSMLREGTNELAVYVVDGAGRLSPLR